MRKKERLIGLLATIMLLPSVGVAQQPIRWEATLETAQRLAAPANRLVMITFWAPWCGVCRRMEADVLNQPSVAAELAANYVAVKINADRFPATAQQYGVNALPTTVITTPQGQVLDTIRGRIGATQYVARLNLAAVEARQNRRTVLAQMPSGTAPPATATPDPVRMPPATDQQPTVTAARPSVGGGPSLGVAEQPSAADSRTPANTPSLSDDRYAEFFRQDQTAPVTPIAQPSSVTPGPTNVQSPASYAQPPQTGSSPTSIPAVAQPYPPSRPATVQQPPAPASTALAYASQSSPPPAQQPAGVQADSSVLPSPTDSPTEQGPALHPPLGLDGYCPVTLTEKTEWAVSDRRWGMIHRGRTYLFVGPKEQARFHADPDRYAPMVSGNDIVLATEQGQAVPGMREHGVFFGNRIYLFSSEATLEKFTLNPHAYANQALGALRTGAYAGQPLQ